MSIMCPVPLPLIRLSTQCLSRRSEFSEINMCVCPLTAEVVSPPADADAVCVADCHIRCHEVALVVFIVEVPRPHDVTELLWGHLHTHR